MSFFRKNLGMGDWASPSPSQFQTYPPSPTRLGGCCATGRQAMRCQLVGDALRCWLMRY
jgi:hypothetical protein